MAERITIMFEVSELPIKKIEHLCNKFDTGVEIIEPKQYQSLDEKRRATRIIMPVAVVSNGNNI